MKYNGKPRTPIIAAQSEKKHGQGTDPENGISGGKKARASRTSKSKTNGVKSLVLERISDGILALDAGLNYTYLNERAGELLGCEAGELIGRSIWQAHPEADGALFAQACRRALETQTIVPLEGYFPPSDRWLEGRVYPSPDGLSVLFSESAGQKQEENRRREERYRILFDTMQEGFLLAEVIGGSPDEELDGRLLEVNASLARFVGRTREGLIGRTFREALELDDGDLRLLRRACLVGLGQEQPFFIERQDPARGRWLRAHIFSPKQGQFASLLSDITEQREAEARVQDISKFPGENPNPVLRFTPQGEILYSNAASELLLKAWKNGEYHTTSLGKIQELLPSVLEEGLNTEIEVVNDRTFYMGLLVPVREQGYINLYLQDITERRQVEESLRAHINQTNAGITRTDLEGRFTFVNQAFCDMLGYSRSELVGRTIWEISHADDIGKNQRLFERMLREGESFQLEKRLLRRNGSVLWVNVGSSPLREASGRIRAATSIIVDITRRKRAEESLLDSARRTLYLASLSDAIRSLDDPWKIQDEAARILGAHLKASRVAYVEIDSAGSAFVRDNYVDGVADIIGEFDLSMCIPESQLDRFRAGRTFTASSVQDDSRFSELQQAAHAGLSIQAQVLVPFIRKGELIAALCVQQSQPRVWKNEELSLVEETADRLQAAVERAHAERKLRESERLFRILSNNAPSAVWTSAPDGTITYANEYWYDYTGLTPEENAVHWPERVLHPDDYERCIREWEHAIQTVPDQYVIEVRNRRHDGVYRWFQTRAVPLRGDDGQVTAWYGVTTDIHDRVEMEEDLRESEQKFSLIYDRLPFAAALSRPQDGMVVDVNQAFERIFGYSKQEALGRNTFELGITTDAEQHARLLAGLQTRGSMHDLELELVTKRNGPRVFRINVDLVNIGGTRYILQTAQDITERKRAEQDLAEFARQQQVLYQLADELNNTESLESVYDPALDAILNALQCDRASILLYDEAQVMRFTAWRGLSEGYRRATDGHSPWTVDTIDPQPICMNDIRAAELEDSLRAVIQSEGIGALAFIPLVVGGRLIGKFMVYYDAPHDFVREELDLSLTIARQLASTIERKRAENSLRQSEQRFREIFETAGVSVWVEDFSEVRAAIEELRASGVQDFRSYFEQHPDFVQRAIGMVRILDVNNQTLELFHAHSKSEILGSLSNIFSPETQPVFVEELVALAEGREMLRSEAQLQTLDGQPVSVIFTVHFNPQSGDYRSVVVTITDITARRESEEALRESEQRYRTLFNLVPVGIYSCDASGLIQEYNPRAVEMWGREPEKNNPQEKYCGSFRMYHPDGSFMPHESCPMALALAGETLQPHEQEVLVERPDGTRRNVIAQPLALRNERGEITGAINCFYDITERKTAEEALRQSEERFTQFMQHLPGLAWIKDLQGRYVYANAAAEKAFGIQKEQLYGKTDREIFPAEVAAQFRQNDEHVLSEEKGLQAVETLQHKDGILHYSLVNKFPIPGPSGSPALIGGTAFDITERIGMEGELKTARRKAEATAWRMSHLQKVTAALSETLTLSQIAQVVVDQGAPALGAVSSTMMVLNEEEQSLEVVYSSSPQAVIRPYVRFPLSTKVPAADAARSRQTVWIESRRQYLESYPHLAEQIERWGNEAAIAIPMIYKERVLGVLTLSFDRVLSYLSEDQEYVLTLARQGAQALERARTEQSLLESEERHRAILSQATAGIVRKDPDGKLLFVNQAFCNMLDYTAQDLIDKTIWEVTHGEDVGENKRLYGLLMEEGTPFHLEKRLIRRDGSTLWVNVSVSPLMDSAGRPISAVSVYVDITRRRKAEGRLALLAKVSELTREHEEPDELLYAVSRVVGEHFQVKRALFNETDVENDREIVHRDYTRGVESVAGVHKISEYSSITSAEMMAGKTVVNHDSKLDPRTAHDYERSYVAHGERAYVAVPLMQDERWVATLWVSDDRPREWVREDVSLLEAIAERTWTAAEKLRIHRALRASEERLRVTFNTTAVGFATLSPETDFLDVNDAYCRIVGYAREELLRMNFDDITHPDYLKSTRDHLARLLDGEVPSFVIEKLYIRKDGVEIWAQNSVSLVRGVDGEPLHLIAICQDVTERKSAEEELRKLNLKLEERVLERTSELQSAYDFLRESEATSRLILESMPDAIVITDSQGHIVHANTQVESLFGYTQNEVLGQRVEILLPERFRGKHLKHRKSYDDQRTRRIMGLGLDLFGRRKDSSEFPVDVMISPIYNNTTWDVMVAIRDNSKQRQAQEAIRANEEKLRTLFEILPVGISFVDREGRIREMNPALTEIVGLSKSQLLQGGSRNRRFIRADGTPMPPSEFASRRAIAEQKTIQNVETGIVKENGAVIWTSVNAAPVKVADLEAAVVTIDITERKQAEEALHRHRERLRVLSRRLVEVQEEERRALARELHDRVGQNLAALTLNLNILRNQLSSDILEKIGTRLNDSVNLVKDILTITRSVMADLRPNVLDDYGLDAALNEYADRFSQLYGIRVSTKTPETPIPRLDPGVEITLLRITQEALTNIARHAQASQAFINLERRKDAILLTVEDNGIGILSWQKVNQSGSHGLRIMRERAEAFGGQVKVHSTYNNGTKIEVSIPITGRGRNTTPQEKRS